MVVLRVDDSFNERLCKKTKGWNGDILLERGRPGLVANNGRKRVEGVVG